MENCFPFSVMHWIHTQLMLRHVTMLDDEVGQTVGSSVLKNIYRAPFKIVILLRQFNLHYSDLGIVNSGYFKMVSFFFTGLEDNWLKLSSTAPLVSCTSICLRLDCSSTLAGRQTKRFILKHLFTVHCCQVPVQHLPRPSRSIHFGDVSENTLSDHVT